MIVVCSSTATGQSPKLAFDNALRKIGMHDFNIVEYSSVIPPNNDIYVKEKYSRDHEVGTPIACVVAEDIRYETETLSNLGWWSDDDGGVFLEFSGEEYVEGYIKEMIKNRGRELKGNPEHVTARCPKNTDMYSCSLCVGVYGEIETKY